MEDESYIEDIETSTFNKNHDDGDKKYQLDFHPWSKLLRKQKTQLCLLCLIINLFVIIIFVLGVLYGHARREIHDLKKEYILLKSKTNALNSTMTGKKIC